VPITPVERDIIRRFLEHLQTTCRGRVMAVDMWHSLRPPIQLSPVVVARFLLECAETYDTKGASPDQAPHIVDDVAVGQGNGGTPYLRQCRQPAFPAESTERLSHTVTWDVFRLHMVSDETKKAVVIPPILPTSSSRSTARQAEFRRSLADTIARPDWRAPKATIGRPYPTPSNCWVTTDAFPADANAPEYHPDDEATKARDELGLCHHKRPQTLVRFVFAASGLAALPGVEVARPTFADSGNARFRAFQDSPRAADFADRGWGATIHLGKLADHAYDEATGVSERVATALPLTDLQDLQVDYLGDVNEDRGVTPGRDDDPAFAQRAEHMRPEDIREDVLTELSRP
jgi:hypothetical protein